MHFTKNTPHYRYEVMMQSVPSIRSHGSGKRYVYLLTAEQTKCDYCLNYRRKKCLLDRCPYIEEKVQTGTATLRQILSELFGDIDSPTLRNRLERFIRESEVIPMPYFNKHHKREFTEALDRIDADDSAQLSAVYLMSADALLWHKSKPFVGASGIDFDKIPVGSIGEKAYTLFACAKDLCKGTKHITLADICDEQIISPKLFGVICTAMAVRRFGIESLNCIKGDVQNDTRRTDK